MGNKQKEKIIYEHDQSYNPVDIINKDLDLLLLLIFIEAYKEGKIELRLTDLIKGNYWDQSDIKDEVFDTNDYGSIEDMALEQIAFLIEDQRLGNVAGVSIDNPNQALLDAVYKATELGPSATKEDVMGIATAVEQITFLEQQNTRIKEKLVEENPDKIREIVQDKSIFIDRNRNYIRALQGIVIEIPEHITLHFIYDEKGIDNFEKEISKYINGFKQDKYIDELPRYQEKRLYFTQQIENFYRYISNLNIVGDTLNIPFSILSERTFEAVKILRYLEESGLAELRWSYEGSWKVKFFEIPITPNSLLGIKNNKKQLKSAKLKFNLSFTPQTGILKLKNNDVEYKIKIQGQVQKEVLRVICRNPKNMYSEWSLYDISSALGPDDADTKSVSNALYQLNKKVKLEIPEVEKLFDFDKHSAVLNEKYIEKK